MPSELHGPRTLFGQTMHGAKYRAPEETYDDYCVRYSRAVTESEEQFRQMLSFVRNQVWLPAGRQQFSVGRPFLTTGFNCFVGGTIPDSFEGIMEALKQGGMTLRTGGGDGWDFSTLRPFGEPIRGLGHGSFASGPISFMSVWSQMCETILSAGHRRGAMMGVLRVDHPDILKFINAKKDQNSLRNFNISVAVTDEFMDAFANDGLYPLKFNNVVFAQVRAVDVWAKIMENNWDWAEPGILFIDRINERNPLYYCENIASTNPCVTGDTLILTKDGYKHIDECLHNSVEIWNGLEWSKVQPRVTGENQEIVDLYFSDGSHLACTLYHSFYIQGEKLEARKLKIGDKLDKWEFPVIEGELLHNLQYAYTQGFYSGDGYIYTELDECRIDLHPAKFCCGVFLDWTNKTTLSNGLRIDLKLPRMKSKDFIPDVKYSIKSRLDWLAGLIDSDGTLNDPSGSIAISSINGPFLFEVKRMLNILGINVTINQMKEEGIKSLPDGRGGNKDYFCQTSYRIVLSGFSVSKLYDLGLRCHRVPCNPSPQRDASRFIQVVDIKLRDNKEAKVYCFTEPKLGKAIFNGILTGQCGEQPLPPHGACLLGSVNIVKLLMPTSEYKQLHEAGTIKSERKYEIDYDLLNSVVTSAVRANDRVIDTTVYPLPEQKAEALAKRRMGIGVTGMANACEILGCRYGSVAYLKLQEKIIESINHAAYCASIELAKEKGPFPLFDAEAYTKGWFCKNRLPEDIVAHIRRYGLRNGLLTSIAPTGTISMTADNVSSGIEPPFATHTRFKIYMPGEGQVDIEAVDHALEFFGVTCKTSEEVTAEEHVDVLCSAQKYIDSSVSKTCNVTGQIAGDGPGVTFDAFKKLYIRAWEGGSKGCTTYNKNGKRSGVREVVSSSTNPDPAQAEFLQDDGVATGTDGLACFYDPTTGQRSCDE